jgi:hypothetical protein
MHEIGVVAPDAVTIFAAISGFPSWGLVVSEIHHMISNMDFQWLLDKPRCY